MPTYTKPADRFNHWYATAQAFPFAWGPLLDDRGITQLAFFDPPVVDCPTYEDCVAYALAALESPPTDGQSFLEKARTSFSDPNFVLWDIGTPAYLIRGALESYLDCISYRLYWFVHRAKSHIYCDAIYLDRWMTKSVDGSDHKNDRNHYAMAYNGRSKKNAGAWFRANEIIRNNDGLRTKVNADTVIQEAGLAMLGHIDDIAQQNGYDPSADGLSAATKSASMFPITKQFWMGYLPFSTYTETNPPVDQHRKDFAEKATLIRDRFYEIVRAYKLATDAYDTDAEANPGGEVDP